MSLGRESRVARWRGLLGVAIVRVRRQTRATHGHVVATVLIVAVAAAGLVLTTGVALALADDPAVDHDADVLITTTESGPQSSIADVEAPRLGASTDRADTIADHEAVTHATPVRTEPIAVAAGDDREPLLLVGVVPGPAETTVAGLPTDELDTEETVVLSEEAAETLDASEEERVTLASSDDDRERSATVTAVEATDDDAGLPIALVHHAALQTITGDDEGDLADSVLVWGEESAATAEAEAVYPNATTETGAERGPGSLFSETLALVTSVLAVLVAVPVCALFVATTAGLTVESDRQTLATLGAIGLPVRSRLAIVAVMTLVTTAVGAAIGVGLGVGAILVVNAIATATIAPGAVAVLDPLVVPYALAVPLIAAVLALPYPLAIAVRTDVLREVSR